MPAAFFASIVWLLVGLRVACIAVFVVAQQGWLLDPSMWADGGRLAADHTTPFHGHPNPFGWRFGFQGLVAMHVVTGVLLLAMCLVPVFTDKGRLWHVRAGRIFVALWLLHLFNGLVNSAQIMLVRGFEPARYPAVTGQGFSLYLYVQFAFISFVVIDFLALGLAALHYKNRSPGRSMRAVMLAMPATSLAFGLGLIVWSVAHLASDTPAASPKSTEFAIVYLVQVPAYLYLIGKNLAYWARPTPRSWLHGWLTEHQRNMMFLVQVTLYTGLANITMRYADWLTPYMFVAIDGGFVVWLLLKERGLRRRIVESRLGLGLVMLLREGASSPLSRRPLSMADQQWIARMVDSNSDGALERAEVRTLLERHGVAPTDAELDELFAALDEDENGIVDASELGSFLVHWFVPEPDAADELALAFRALDSDGDGHITARELCAALDTGDDPLTREEVNELISAIDLDGNGALDWEEFRAAMSPHALGERMSPALAVPTRAA